MQLVSHILTWNDKSGDLVSVFSHKNMGAGEREAKELDMDKAR